MKWTSANVKNPNYTEKHEIFVGTETGTFKKLLPTYEKEPFAQKNLQDLAVLDKGWNITSLTFGNEDKTEILIGRGHDSVQLFSTKLNKIEYELKLQASPVVGVVRYKEQLIAGFSNGKMQYALLEDGDITEHQTYSSGDNMSHLRQCAVQRNLIATGGKERQNNVKVFDIEAGEGKPIFTSKNVPPDYLQLEVPVWDSDVGFIDSPHILATCSRTGYVRVYDTRKQRRPVQCYANEQQMSFCTLVASGNYIYTGSTMGHLKAFDIRQMKNFVHTYKGYTGAVSDLCLDDSGKYLASSSLDRYVRVHDVNSTVLLYQCYVKSKATRILLRNTSENPNSEEDADVSESKSKKNKNKKNSKGKEELSDDEEYEDMFEQMPTIDEQAESAQEEEGTVEEDHENLVKVGEKRKLSEKTLKTKKMK